MRTLPVAIGQGLQFWPHTFQVKYKSTATATQEFSARFTDITFVVVLVQKVLFIEVCCIIVVVVVAVVAFQDVFIKCDRML